MIPPGIIAGGHHVDSTRIHSGAAGRWRSIRRRRKLARRGRRGARTVHREKLVTLASRYKLPMSCHSRELVQAGALMAYGPSQRDGYLQAGIYTGRILKGERPSELPVQLATSFELVLNLKTAKELGITMTSTMLTAADEVIE
jgi:putative ABC transport system substrate-binding protein